MSSQPEQQEQPITQVEPVRPIRPSVVHFDHAEFITNNAATQCSTMTVEQLLKYTIARASTEKNPVVASGCERILKQINREPTPFNRNRHGRGGKPR